MRIIEDEIIIDDPYIVNFVSKHGTQEFLSMCEDMLKNVCKLCEKNLKEEDNLDKIMSHLGLFKQEFTSANELYICCRGRNNLVFAIFLLWYGRE